MILYRRNVNGTLIHQLHNCLKCDRDCLASIPSPSPGCKCIELQGHLSWTHLSFIRLFSIKHISAYVLGYLCFCTSHWLLRLLAFSSHCYAEWSFAL